MLLLRPLAAADEVGDAALCRPDVEARGFDQQKPRDDDDVLLQLR
jgi:hypothetical protein